MKRQFVLLIIMLGCVCGVLAQSPKLSFNSFGIFDCSVSGYDMSRGTQFLYSIEDLRIGLAASYKNAEIKADVSIDLDKVRIRNLLLNYHFKNSFISVGNIYEPFSIDILANPLDMLFHQSSASSLTFVDGRKLGMSYNLDLPKMYFAMGLYTNNDINTTYSERSNAFISAARLIFRLTSHSGNLFHIGGAYVCKTAEGKVNGATHPRTVSSMGVTSLFDEPIISVTLNDAGVASKGVIETVALFRKWSFQGEYFLCRQALRDVKGIYRPHGGYAQMSYLIIGSGYNYDSAYALPKGPACTKSLELVARYNYTTLNDRSVNLYGGSEQDISLGVNYYINNYFAVKFNGSYVIVGEHCMPFYYKDQFICQLRLQFNIPYTLN